MRNFELEWKYLKLNKYRQTNLILERWYEPLNIQFQFKTLNKQPQRVKTQKSTRRRVSSLTGHRRRRQLFHPH